MKAKKYISKREIEMDNKTYELVKYEVKDINLSELDWYWLYTEIMEDDYECAQNNGFYETEDDFHSIDCQRVAERMVEWEEIMSEDDQPITNLNQDFQDTFSRILAIMNENLDFTIYYEDKQ